MTLTHIQLIGETSTGRLINLTPHAVVVNGLTVPPSGQVARVATSTVPDGALRNGDSPIPLVKTAYGAVTDLLDSFPGDYFIVSTLVRLAVPNRKDLLSPSGLVRDASGNVIGCAALEGN